MMGAGTTTMSGDIANAEVRPDVYKVVHKMINPAAMGRFVEPRPDAPPKEMTWEMGPPKKEPEPAKPFKLPEPVEELDAEEY